MANELFIYTAPPAAAVTLTLDDGTVITGSGPMSANGRSDAHLIQIPARITTGLGWVLEVSHAQSITFRSRGLLVPSASGPAQFVLDEVRLPPAPEPAAPAPRPTSPPILPSTASPFDIIKAVQANGRFDLQTKEGCGQFTEAACQALHDTHSSQWGHIRKFGAQNQFNGHAVDAIMLLKKTGDTDAGIYDIVFDSEGSQAKPAWSFKGEPNPSIWFFPA